MKKPYRVQVRSTVYRFATMEEAQDKANKVFRKTGTIIGIWKA